MGEQKERSPQLEKTSKNQTTTTEATAILEEHIRANKVHEEVVKSSVAESNGVKREPAPKLPFEKPGAIHSNDRLAGENSTEQQAAHAPSEALEVQEEQNQTQVFEVLEDQISTEEPQALALEQMIETSAEAWEEVLNKEDPMVYDDFTQALHAFNDSFLLRSSGGESPDAELADAETVPEIVGVVAERLDTLAPEEKEEVTMVLKNIIGAIHGLQLLETRNAEPHAVEIVEAQLKQLCIELFETTGIEYSEQDVEEFMAVLLHKDFRPTKQTEPTSELIDLEHVGTREGKRAARSASGHGMRDQLEQVIGMFAVAQHIAVQISSIAA